MANDPHAKRLLWFIFAGSRGGLNRLRIISTLKKQPKNTNQLANELGLDYKAIQHHINVLVKNNLLVKEGEKYGITFFISTFLEVNMESFDEIAQKLDRREMDGVGWKYMGPGTVEATHVHWVGPSPHQRRGRTRVHMGDT